MKKVEPLFIVQTPDKTEEIESLSNPDADQKLQDHIRNRKSNHFALILNIVTFILVIILIVTYWIFK